MMRIGSHSKHTTTEAIKWAKNIYEEKNNAHTAINNNKKYRLEWNNSFLRCCCCIRMCMICIAGVSVFTIMFICNGDMVITIFLCYSFHIKMAHTVRSCETEHFHIWLLANVGGVLQFVLFCCCLKCVIKLWVGGCDSCTMGLVLLYDGKIGRRCRLLSHHYETIYHTTTATIKNRMEKSIYPKKVI